jgi:hypothetical protein
MEGRKIMIGYCEACKGERPCNEDEYGVACCTDCGTDITVEMHVMVDVEVEDDFGDWINQS